MSHGKRAALASRFPVHVTVKLRRGLQRLRRNAAMRVDGAHGAFRSLLPVFGLPTGAWLLDLPAARRLKRTPIAGR